MSNENNSPSILRVVGAKLKFGKNDVLSGIHLDVPEGIIYTLLGASGCGKTTLLNCIVGITLLDSGSVYRQWRSFTDIGFMPQEVALNPYLTIKELFKYFSKVTGLVNSQFLDKASEISKILALPSWDKIIGTLSGGEQKRVSLAVTVLHEPKFLILDEPTVGQDPVLRQSIWDFLVTMVETRNKTVLITTHYMQEAAGANIVGMMRKGVMVLEESPSRLFERFSGGSLEEVFYYFSNLQDQSDQSTQLQERDIELYPLKTSDQANSINESCQLFDGQIKNCLVKKSRFLAELHKNCLVLWRSKAVLMFQILVPIFIQVVWLTCVGSLPTSIKLGVVNEELSTSLDNCYFEINSTSCLGQNKISCIYTRMLQSKLDVELYRTIEDGLNDVRATAISGLIHFSENYTQSFLARVIDNSFNTSEEIIEQSSLTVWMDSSNYIISSYVQDTLSHTLLDFLEELFEVCHWGRPNFFPFALQDPVFGSWDTAHQEATTPAFLITLSMYFASAYPVAVLIEEKASSILRRASVLGVTAFEIISASLIINCLLSLIQAVENLLLIFAVLKIPYNGSMVTIFLFTFNSSLFGIIFGILTACLTKSATVGILCTICLASTITSLSGAIWPQEAQSPILQYFKWLYPCSYVAESLRSVMVKAKLFSDFSVYSGFLHLLGYNTALILIVCLILWRTRALNV